MVMLAIIFVLFQSFATPLAMASWTGDAWKGDAWKGDAWSGSDLQWEGESWKGDSWKQNGWVQDGWEQDGWTQEGWSQDNWNQDGWTQDQWRQDGWTGDGVTPINPATGKPWTGEEIGGINPATGKPWTGEEIGGINPATGKPWTGEEIGGINPATGKPWTGEEISGINPETGKPWTGEEISGINPETGKPWAGSDISGVNPATGQPWANGEMNGINPVTGNPWSEDIGQGNLFGGEAPDKIDVDPYEAAKFIINDAVAGQVRVAFELESGDFSLKKPNSLTGLVMNGIKLGVGDSTAFNYVYDGYDLADKVSTGITGFKERSMYKQLAANGVDLSNYNSLNNLPPTSSLKMLSKLNVGAAGISTIFSTIDTVKNGMGVYDTIKKNGWTSSKSVAAGADTAASFGEVLMNGGVVVGAFPGGQAFGAGMVVAGATLWGASKVVKGIASGSLKKAAKKVKDKVDSWVSSIKGVFS